MFTKKDLIGVGVSGGKDSIDLLFVLNELGYNIIAITIDEGIKGYRNETIPFVKKLCKKLSIPLHIYSFKEELGKTLDQIVKKKRGMLAVIAAFLEGTCLTRQLGNLGAIILQ